MMAKVKIDLTPMRRRGIDQDAWEEASRGSILRP